jgi:hypothetical protein
MRVRPRIRVALTIVMSMGMTVALASASEFEPPRQLLAGGKPIDVQRLGHSAPFVGDFDNDGLDDLLVGEFSDGRLRIFRNIGSRAEAKFDTYHWFEAGGELGRVPVG